MTHYYYLNNQQEAQGPHTEEELRAMLASGELTPLTLAAPVGSDRWMPLEEALRANLSGAAGPCPRCHQELSCTAGQLPEQCPACGYRLRSASPGNLWQAFLLGFKKYATFRGRATRTEFWGFWLFLTLASFLVQNICGIIIGSSMFLDAWQQQFTRSDGISSVLPDAVPLPIVIISAFYLLFKIATIIPSMAVTVRRLHDAGWSGWWFFLPLASPFLLVTAAAYATTSGGPVNVLPIILIVSAVGLFLGAAILIFVLSILDSQHGSNKYGASPKYPLG